VPASQRVFYPAMSPIAISLIILSAFMHAGWNLFSKRQQPSAAFFLIASLAGGVLLAPVMILYHDTVAHHIPARVWGLLLSTGFFMALYYIALAGAYRAGDISVAYPLARSSPVIVVTVVTLLLGRGDQVSRLCVCGILLVVAGCFLIPLQRFGDLRLKHYLNRTCALALLAAIGTAGYSILDDEALRLLRTDTHVAIGNTPITLVYACLEALASALWLALFVGLRRRGRASLGLVLRAKKKPAVFAGIAIYLTYAIVLVSLAFVDNVSYVVGFRQLSIPLGAMLGVFVLKEAPHAPKLVGVTVMFVGLVLVAMG
jgi:drug/metabolite transporter (DMT)-like permease